jgi:hypothetical protein
MRRSVSFHRIDQPTLSKSDDQRLASAKTFGNDVERHRLIEIKIAFPHNNLAIEHVG